MDKHDVGFPTLDVDRSGTLLTDYFYAMYFQLPERVGVTTHIFKDVDKANSIIVDYKTNARGQYYAQVAPQKKTYSETGWCSRDKTHQKFERILAVAANINPGIRNNVYPDFLPDDGGVAFMDESLAADLREQKFRGAETKRLEILEDESDIENLHIEYLLYSDDSALRSSRVTPKESNACPWCGSGPAFCPECGYSTVKCRKCEKWLAVPPREHTGVRDRRILMVQPRPRIVDVSRWDGSDFIGATGYGIVTKRALDFFLSRHVSPLVAIPLPAAVDGISKEQKAMLEEALG